MSGSQLHPSSSGKRESLPYLIVHEQQLLNLYEYFHEQNHRRELVIFLIIVYCKDPCNMKLKSQRMGLVEDRFKTIGFLIKNVAVLTALFGILISFKVLAV